MKPFNLELAKTGHPVCTRNGKKARIICFDRKCEHSHSLNIVALLENRDGTEFPVMYHKNGMCSNGPYIKNDDDLFMKDIEENKNYDEIIQRIEALEKFKNEMEAFNVIKYNSRVYSL